MVSESSSAAMEVATKKRGNGMHSDASRCAGIVYIVTARAIWPRKTAAEWAAKAGVKERMAKYWLSGTRPISADGKLAILRQFN